VDTNPFFCPDAQAAAKWEAYLDGVRKSGSSCGAVIEIVAEGVPPGWGAPIYGKLDSEIASAFMSINAVKGVEIGEGMAAASAVGRRQCRRDAQLGNGPACRISCRTTPAVFGRHFHGPANRRAVCGQADVVNPHAAPLG
jgi:chorismate synthase